MKGLRLKNWLNQDINVGDIVYRGAREGNTSSFKIGRVKKINDDSRNVTIGWIIVEGNDWENKNYGTKIPKKAVSWSNKKSQGTCSVDVVFKVENDPVVMKFIAQFEDE